MGIAGRLKRVEHHRYLWSHTRTHKKSLSYPILPGGGGGGGFRPLMFFFHHPETAQAMKLKLSDFKDTCLRHILQVISGCYILRFYHENKITKGTLQNLTQ